MPYNNCDMELLRHPQQQLMLKQHDHTNERLRTSKETGRYLELSKRSKVGSGNLCFVDKTGPRGRQVFDE